MSQPLGIEDVVDGHVSATWQREHWYWCRRHEQAHSAGRKCRDICRHTMHWCSDPTHELAGVCIDVGPFMSDREANRLNPIDNNGTRSNPLGMEVEA